MTKADFINHLAAKLNITKAEADHVFLTVFDALTDVLMDQDKMMVPDFGTFSTKIREEKTGRNPATGKEMLIPRAVVAHFKPAPKLKEKLNKN
ncbi:MAG: HU family DNA-binding protein [Gammaproteobacteria bacterium]|nr:HU family DNA-binding protein [Gammaproteobacteria bacterium]MCD8525343.1 HU family DNA-binding protein [Gammaproteobacteria bacterium]MCD8543129.1 HU family DNA-binding protein [Gammaproteobacteria bacterium]MCD8573885.1 HU family DNA-binding protein [Gammaproteobacteria bacterium]